MSFLGLGALGAINPFVGAAMIGTGGALVGGLGSWLGGRGELKRLQDEYNASKKSLLGEVGKDLFDPQQAMAMFDVANWEQMQGAGNQIARASGNVSATDAQRALWSSQIGMRDQRNANLWLENAMGKADKDLRIKQQVFGNAAQALSSWG